MMCVDLLSIESENRDLSDVLMGETEKNSLSMIVVEYFYTHTQTKKNTQTHQ